MRKDLEEKVNKRIAILQGLMTLAFILLTGWLFGVQVLDLSGYKAKGIAIRSTDSPTLRGNILDRNGIKLTTDELLEKLKSKKINIITLKKDVDRHSVEKINKLKLREISIGTINRRFYPQGNIASHIIGFYSYLSQNSIGIENIGGGKLSFSIS